MVAFQALTTACLWSFTPPNIDTYIHYIWVGRLDIHANDTYSSKLNALHYVHLAKDVLVLGEWAHLSLWCSRAVLSAPAIVRRGRNGSARAHRLPLLPPVLLITLTWDNGIHTRCGRTLFILADSGWRNNGLGIKVADGGDVGIGVFGRKSFHGDLGWQNVARDRVGYGHGFGGLETGSSIQAATSLPSGSDLSLRPLELTNGCPNLGTSVIVCCLIQLSTERERERERERESQ